MRKYLSLALALILLVAPLTIRATAKEYTDAEYIAKVLWAECRGVESTTEQAAVAWCILNRVDDDRWGDTVAKVVKQPHQFAYSSRAPVTDELLALAQDVLLRYELEKLDTGEVGRVLPAEYTYFTGNGKHNYFTKKWRSRAKWDWSAATPYEN